MSDSLGRPGDAIPDEMAQYLQVFMDETDEQLELLRAAGCRNYQGYRVAKPLPADELLRLVSHRSMVLAARPT